MKESDLRRISKAMQLSKDISQEMPEYTARELLGEVWIRSKKTVSRKDAKDATMKRMKRKHRALPPGGMWQEHSPDPHPDSGLRKHVAEALLTLTPREERVVRLHYGFMGERSDLILAEIGEEMQCGAERVRQIIAKGCRKLKHPSRSRRLRPYHSEYDQIDTEHIDKRLNNVIIPEAETGKPRPPVTPLEIPLRNADPFNRIGDMKVDIITARHLARMQPEKFFTFYQYIASGHAPRNAKEGAERHHLPSEYHLPCEMCGFHVEDGRFHAVIKMHQEAVISRDTLSMPFENIWNVDVSQYAGHPVRRFISDSIIPESIIIRNAAQGKGRLWLDMEVPLIELRRVPEMRFG